MKKRSLVAALAMLMVSAIVLTSSTYAWFATGNTAKLSGVSATVGNADGSISISANGTDYTATLKYSDFLASDGHFVPAAFKPVSFDPVNGTIIGGGIAQGADQSNTATLGKPVFDAENVKNSSEHFIKLTVHLKATVDCEVKVKADMTQSVYNFIYAAAFENEATTPNYAVFNVASRTYTPVSSATDGIDTDSDDIMTKDDLLTDGKTEYNALGTSVTAKPDNSITIELTKNVAKTITFYVWAEGNDVDCSGQLESQACTVGLTFDRVMPEQPPVQG